MILKLSILLIRTKYTIWSSVLHLWYWALKQQLFVELAHNGQTADVSWYIATVYHIWAFESKRMSRKGKANDTKKEQKSRVEKNARSRNFTSLLPDRIHEEIRRLLAPFIRHVDEERANNAREHIMIQRDTYTAVPAPPRRCVHAPWPLRWDRSGPTPGSP